MNETIKDVVEKVLKEYPKSRDDDFLLCLHVYIRLGFAKRSPLGITIYFKNQDSFPAFETITRIRRYIQHNEGRFLASMEVQLQRKNHEIQIHDYYATKPYSKSKAFTFPNSQYMSD